MGQPGRDGLLLENSGKVARALRLEILQFSKLPKEA